MNAVLPIAIEVIQRPAFDNERIADFGLWTLDNAAILARYWTEQGNALGLGKDENTDFDFWLKVQHNIECDDFRVAACLPHGVTL